MHNIYFYNGVLYELYWIICYKILLILNICTKELR